MHFREYPLLNTPHLVLLILREASQGEASVEACTERLKSVLDLADEHPPYGDAELARRLDVLRHHLTEAQLIAPAGNGRFTLTARGRQALEAHPSGLDLADLMIYPEFAEFIHRLAAARDRMDPRTPAYDEGYAAFRAGAYLADNPYPGDTVDHLAWENGWYEALDEKSDQPPP